MLYDNFYFVGRLGQISLRVHFHDYTDIKVPIRKDISNWNCYFNFEYVII